MKLEVPYYSQFLDITDSFWMIRACGATSIKSIGEFYGIAMPDLIFLCEEAKERIFFPTASFLKRSNSTSVVIIFFCFT